MSWKVVDDEESSPLSICWRRPSSGGCRCRVRIVVDVERVILELIEKRSHPSEILSESCPFFEPPGSPPEEARDDAIH